MLAYSLIKQPLARRRLQTLINTPARSIGDDVENSAAGFRRPPRIPDLSRAPTSQRITAQAQRHIDVWVRDADDRCERKATVFALEDLVAYLVRYQISFAFLNALV